MTPSHSETLHSPPGEKTGSALLLTILTVSLLLILTLSLTAFVRLELKNQANRQALTVARLHARLGLELAVASLQKTSGLDTRVTAPASLELPTSLSIAADSSGASALSQVNTYWNSQRNPHWTGVWYNGNLSDFDPENPADFNSQPILLSWLVSQSDPNTPIQASEQITGLSAASTIDNSFTDSMNRAHTLLVTPKASADVSTAVTAALVDLKAGKMGGRYAWWVGDEGVKARLDVEDPYLDAPDQRQKLLQRASAQRPVIEMIDPSSSLGTRYQPNDPQLPKVSGLQDFHLLDTDGLYGLEVEKRFHDLTLHSLGVIADTRNGGLKRDLTYILGQKTASETADTLSAFNAYSSRVLDENKLSPMTEIPDYADAYPSNTHPRRPSAPPGMFAYTPTWEKLRSFYHLGNRTTDSPAGALNATGQLVPRLRTAEDQGIGPLVIQTKLFYGLDSSPGSNIVLTMRPQVVLANPFTVDMADATYRFRLQMGFTPFLHVLPLSASGLNDPHNISDLIESRSPEATLSNGGLESANVFVIQSGVIPAGEARVYTLDRDYTLPESTADQYTFTIRLTPGLGDNELRKDTGVVMPASPPSDPALTNAALLYGGKYYDASGKVHHPTVGMRYTKLYLESASTSAEEVNDMSLVHATEIQGSGNLKHQNFLVYPNRERGGGCTATLWDATPSSYTKARSLFRQQNYRGIVISGFAGGTGSHHWLEWSRSQSKNGADQNHNYFQSNLMGLQSPNFDRVLWGVVNYGKELAGGYGTVMPDGIDPSNPPYQICLYDIPDGEIPLSSLARFQHLDVSTWMSSSSWSSHPDYHNDMFRSTHLVQSWQNDHSIGNSFPNVGVARDHLIDSTYAGYQYDGSYLWNQVLYDRFFFSTYPASGPVDLHTETLANSRIIPFRDYRSVSPQDEENFRGDGNPTNPDNSRMAATNLMLNGAFNVNSTSKDAWKALLAGLHGQDIGSETGLTAPFPRHLKPSGGTESAGDASHPNSWSGFRDLSNNQLDQLAEEIVLQVRRRGPFLSLADFVNRQLIDATSDTYGLGLKGALQDALERVTSNLNPGETLNGRFETPSSDLNAAPKLSDLYTLDKEYLAETVLEGHPGQISQADILQVIGPCLTARSDTFRIRAYGETDSGARAWCEAIVQRKPDYMIPAPFGGDAPYDDPLSPVNQAFGRRYHIVSFRWLSPEDL